MSPNRQEDAGTETRGWFQRLKNGLKRSSDKLVGNISALFTKKRLDDETIEELEELLITADLGVATAARLTQNLAAEKFDKEVTNEEVRESFATDIADILEPIAQPLTIDHTRNPHVVLVCGVNGSGKTTTIGKLARQWKSDGLTVWLAAGDTFRAAAIEQLQAWGQRAGATVIAMPKGSDPAALAFDAMEQAQAASANVLVVDTAGRLQNRAELMEELAKVVRVIRKHDATAPHDCLLVLDGMTGQNVHSQVKVFREMVDVTGLIVTKLDGSARGGVVVALAQEFGLPVHAVGVGEQPEDLRSFEALAFARSLMGLE